MSRAPKAAGILAKSRTPAAKAPAHVFSGDKSEPRAGAVPSKFYEWEIFISFFYCERHPPEKENSRDPFTERARAFVCATALAALL
jgi:hypothetical protein